MDRARRWYCKWVDLDKVALRTELSGGECRDDSTPVRGKTVHDDHDDDDDDVRRRR